MEYVWQHNLMNGVSSAEFSPDETASRAMIWTILARLHDVSTDTGSVWYEQGMQWAVQQGVSDGTDPLESITREQFAAMLWRDAGSPSAADSLSSFSDSGAVSGYAQAAMCWAVANGIMQGSDGMLAPGGAATRAETAAIIAHYAQYAG